MKKMIKFIPLLIAPALALVACANANEVKTDENSVVTDNAITTFKVTVDFNGGTHEGHTSEDFTVRKGTYYKYFKTKLPTGGEIEYGQHTFKHYSTTRDGNELDGEYQLNGDLTLYAVYTPDVPETTYSVTWLNRGGTTLLEETDKYHAGETPTYKGVEEEIQIDNPTPGITYKFDHWTPAITPITNANQTYTAVFTEVTSSYTVSFDTHGGSSVAAQQVSKGGKVTKPTTNPTKTGYDFDGWWTLETGGTAWNFDSDTITENTTIHAHWKDGSNIHTITFHHQDGTPEHTSTGTVRNGERLATPAVPTKEGHRFDGWFATAEGGTAFNFETIFTEETLPDDALYAHWTNVTPVDKITVNFDSQGGTSVPGKTIDKGTAVSEPTAPSKVGYDFDGWWTEATGGDKWVFTTTIDADKTLFAHWKDGSNVRTITFDPKNGGETFTKTVRIGERLAAPTVPTYAGHKFDGWFTAASGGDQFNFDTKFEAGTLPDSALYAHWTADPTPATKVTVTFDSQGGTTFQALTFDKGGKATNPGTPIKEGYHFTGWYETKTGGTQWDFGTAINDNKTLYAQWDDEGNIHTVTFHPENGGSIFTKDVRNGECLAAPAVPTYAGHKFDGWFTAQTGGTQFDFSTKFTKDTTTTDLYAQWTNVTPTDKITVNFDSQGGTSVPGKTIDKGTAVSEPTAPSKVGYDFDGWWTETTGGDKWVFTTTIDADKTLFAHWKDGSNVRTITFHHQDGTTETTTTGTVRNGERLAAPEVPTRDGYKFDGWYKEAACTNIFNFDTVFESTTLPGNALYAKWTNVTPTTYYTVTFDTQGGTNVESKQIAAGGLVTDPGQGATTKTGYTFGGWYKEAACTTEWKFNTDTVNAHTTIYAKWTVNKVTITFNPNGGTWSTGGTGNKPVDIEYGNMPNPGATVSKTGYEFNGWSPTLSPATTATTYTAQWILKDYVVTFYDSNGSTKLYEIPVKYNTKVNKPKDPTAPSGKVFDKWVTTQGGSTEFDFNNPITAATSVYAKYKDATYHIRWMNPDMSILDEADVVPGTIPTYGGDTPTMGPDVNHRYSFAGWSPTVYPADSDMTYFATYNTDDEIEFSYDSDVYQLDGELSFTRIELYGSILTCEFGDVIQLGGWEELLTNMRISIDGGEQLTPDKLVGAFGYNDDNQNFYITLDLSCASEITSGEVDPHLIRDAHSIRMEVYKYA